MLEHKVDFIGGDFNMSAFSTVSDVFSDPEFSAPGHSCLWGLGALDEQHRECTVFSSCPSVHMNGVWIRMAATNLTILRLALAPEINLLIFLSSSISAILISLGLTVLCEVSRPSKEDLNADATKNEGRDEVLVRALVNQGVSDASQQVHMCPSCYMMLSDCERILICFF